MNLDLFVSKCSSDIFLQREENVRALKYLTDERKLTPETVRQFSIGYCYKNFPEYDFMKLNRKVRGHIIVPIRSEFGRVVAVSARSPIAEEKGWWNQSFDKKNYLFMLDIAKKHIFKENKAYLFEGYFDAIVSYQYDVKNICSLMSVNFGHRRMGILARYCDQICLCYDSDANESGQNALLKSIYEMHQYGWDNISKITLPVGIDPDEFIIQNGKEEFLNLEKKLTTREIVEMSKKYEEIQKNK